MEQVDSLKTTKKFKKTEIGEIPVDWENYRLKNLISFNYGEGLPEKNRKGNTYPVYGSNGIVGYHNKSLVKGPGIIVGRKGTVGSITWADTDFWPIDTTYYVTLNTNRISFRWLFYYLIHVRLDRLNASTGIPGLNRQVALETMAAIPPLPEQKKIAEILSTVDKVIEKSNELVEKTKELKKGLMQELLTRGIGHKKFKRTTIGEIPEDWEILSLGEISEEVYRYPTYYNIEYVEQGVPEVRGELIKSDGTLEQDFTKYRYISAETSAKFPRTHLREGDLVMSVRGTMGKVAIIPKSLDGANMTANLIRISPDRSRIFPSFLHQTMISNRFQTLLDITSSSTTIKTIKAPEFKRMKFAVPPLPEQKKVAEILTSVDEEIKQETIHKEELKRTKKGLTQVLLTGKVRVKV